MSDDESQQLLAASHPLAAIEPPTANRWARLFCGRTVQVHVAAALVAAGADPAELQALPLPPPDDLAAWAVQMLDRHLATAFSACLFEDGAREMKKGAAGIGQSELAIEQTLVVLGVWLDDIADQVQGVAQEQGFGGTGLVLQSLRSSLLAVRDVFAGNAVDAALHVCDAAGIQDACAEAGRQGFSAELLWQTEQLEAVGS
jgi:hypothetical protein